MTESLVVQENKVVRQKCPFYGFHGAMGMFMDSNGNQCPLKGGYSPCIFVYDNKEPNWNECPFNRDNPSLLETIKDMRVFPDEFRPKGATSWTGIKFEDWQKYALEGTRLPIDVEIVR